MKDQMNAVALSHSQVTRRSFIKGSATLFGLSLVGTLSACGGGDSPGNAAVARSTPRPLADQSSYLLPSEEAPHAATYMAFASGSEGIWTPITPQSTDAGIDRIRADLIDVAKAIGTYEPVTMLVLPVDVSVAQGLLSAPSGANPDIHAGYVARPAGVGGVTLMAVVDGFDDIWTRDMGCLFVKDTANGNAQCAVNFNFNGWGNANTDGLNLNAGMTVPPSVTASSNKSKAGRFFQPFSRDRTVAGWMANANSASVVQSSLTLEGGAIEFDGAGTAILTESSVLHVNRNPQLFNIPGGVIANATLLPNAKSIVLAELQRTLGVQKIIWIPGIAIYPANSGSGGGHGAATPADETDITNGHVDFYARFLAPGVVAYAYDASNSTGERALTEANWQHLHNQTDATGRSLQLVELTTPEYYGTSNGTTLNDSQLTNFAAGYVNFYTCNNAIIVPRFNDSVADSAAIAAIQPYAGSRTIVQVDILGIAAGGGGIHCVTREVPA